MPDKTDRASSNPMLPSRREIVSRIFRHRRVAIVVFLLVLVLCALTGQYSKHYSATMGILVRKERVDSVLTPTQNSTPVLLEMDVSEQELNSEVELLKSYDLQRQVVVEAKLAPSGPNNDIVIARAVRKLAAHLDVFVIPKSNMISVKYTSDNPHAAQAVLENLGKLYFQMHQQLHGNSDQVSFLNEQVQQHRNALEAAEDKLRSFMQDVGVVSASLERDITVQEMKSTEQQELNTDADVVSAGAKAATLRRELAATSPRIATASSNSDNAALLERFKSKLLDLQLQRAQLLAKYDPHYRLVQDVDAQIAIVRSILSDQAHEPVTSGSTDVNPVVPKLQENLDDTEADMVGLRAKQGVLSRGAAQLKTQAERLQTQDLTQEDLLRDVKTEEQQYELYVNKREEARMSASLDKQGILNVLIAEPPLAPALPDYSTKFIVLVTSFAALILALGAAFIADIFDPTIRTSSELHELLTIPLIEEFGDGIHIHKIRGAA